MKLSYGSTTNNRTLCPCEEEKTGYVKQKDSGGKRRDATNER